MGNPKEGSSSTHSNGKYARGIAVSQAALKAAEENVDPDHPDVATSLNHLALLYDAQGQYAEAEPLYKRALVIREKAPGSAG